MSFVGKKIRDSQSEHIQLRLRRRILVISMLRLWNIIETTKKPKRIDDLHPYILNHTALSNQRQPTRLIV